MGRGGCAEPPPRGRRKPARLLSARQTRTAALDFESGRPCSALGASVSCQAASALRHKGRFSRRNRTLRDSHFKAVSGLKIKNKNKGRSTGWEQRRALSRSSVCLGGLLRGGGSGPRRCEGRAGGASGPLPDGRGLTPGASGPLPDARSLSLLQAAADSARRPWLEARRPAGRGQDRPGVPPAPAGAPRARCRYRPRRGVAAPGPAGAGRNGPRRVQTVFKSPLIYAVLLHAAVCGLWLS